MIMAKEAKKKSKICLITGANRGIGYEVCRQLRGLGHTVILTSRNIEKGKKAAEQLHADYSHLDVADEASIKKAAAYVKRKYGKLQVLVNNAGILLDGASSKENSAFTLTLPTLEKTIRINTMGPFLMCQHFIPLMEKGGRVINISSGLGQLSEMEGGYSAYRISKAALNAVTRIFAAEAPHLKINSVCPGWVRTDMGGKNAELPVEKGAETIVWLATAGHTQTGKFFRDKKVIGW